MRAARAQGPLAPRYKGFVASHLTIDEPHSPTPMMLSALRRSAARPRTYLAIARRLPSTAVFHPNNGEETSPWPSADNIGSASPWASNGAWDAVGEQVALDEAPPPVMDREAFAIPFTEAESIFLPSEREILDAYERQLQIRSANHLGYPYNLVFEHDDLHRFLRYSINNLGDPFVASNYGVHSRDFECAVIDFFARLWKIEPDESWGYVTTCGTEGNLHGMLLARECHPNGVLYTSRETHYSIFKAAKYYKMDLEIVDTLPMGEIDYDGLARALEANRGRPAIVNVNVGTTVKGAVDNLDRILRTLKYARYAPDDYHIHCDGALFALMLPFVDHAPEISFAKSVDSMTVSGHKMLGCPMPCGVALTRKKHVEKVEQRIDYLNSVDTTIMGSRNGQAALFMWHSLRRKGVEGIKRDVQTCLSTARYLRDRLVDAGVRARLNDLSTTVVLERPCDEAFVRRWQLACEEDIAHVVVMPNVTEQKVDIFVAELVKSMHHHGLQEERRPDSPLALLSNQAWGGVPLGPARV